MTSGSDPSMYATPPPRQPPPEYPGAWQQPTWQQPPPEPPQRRTALPLVLLLLMVGSFILGCLFFVASAAGGTESGDDGSGSSWWTVLVIVPLALVFPVRAWRRTSSGRPVEPRLWRSATITGTVVLTLATLALTATNLDSSTMVVTGAVLGAGWYLAYVSARVGNLEDHEVTPLSDSFLTTSAIWGIAGLLASAFAIAQGISDTDGVEAVRGVYTDALTGATIFLVPTTVSLHAKIRRAERGAPDPGLSPG